MRRRRVRLAIASHARTITTGPDVNYTRAVSRWGTTVSVLTDNGAIFTATGRRGGRTPYKSCSANSARLHQLPAVSPANLRGK